MAQTNVQAFSGDVAIAGNFFGAISGSNTAVVSSLTTTGQVKGGTIVGTHYGQILGSNAANVSTLTTTGQVKGGTVVGTSGVYGAIKGSNTATVSSLTVNNTTQSTSKTTGALIVSGGLGVASNVTANRLWIDDYILHTGDTNTYMGFSAADTIVMRTNGTDRLTISSSGTVTIAGTLTAGGFSGDDISTGTVAAARVATLNQNTTGSAATLTTTRTIGGVSFNGSGDINLPGVNAAGNQNTSGTATNSSTSVLATDATNSNRPVIFGTATTGNVPLKTDAGLLYNPFSNKLTVSGGLSTSVTPGNYLTGSAYDGSTARTFAVDATTASTASKVVARDASKNVFVNNLYVGDSTTLGITKATGQYGSIKTLGSITSSYEGYAIRDDWVLCLMDRVQPVYTMTRTINGPQNTPPLVRLNYATVVILSWQHLLLVSLLPVLRPPLHLVGH